MDEREMRLYVIRGCDSDPITEIEPQFMMTTDNANEVFEAGTSTAQIKIQRSPSAPAVGPNATLQLHVLDWKQNEVLNQTVSFQSGMTVNIPVGPRDYHVDATLLDGQVALDRAHLHFAVKSPPDVSSTVNPTNPLSSICTQAEYYNPWYSKLGYPITELLLHQYDKWLSEDVIPSNYTHLNNVFPWADIEVLPGVFRWEECDRRNQLAISAGMDITAFCSPSYGKIPFVPDWWVGDLQLNQHGRPIGVGVAGVPSRYPSCDYWYTHHEGLLNWVTTAVRHFHNSPAVNEYRFLLLSYQDQVSPKGEHSYFDYSNGAQEAFQNWLSDNGKTPYALPKIFAIPGIVMVPLGPDLSPEFVDMIDFKTHTAVQRIASVASAVREVDTVRPLSFYRGRNAAIEAAIPTLQQYGGSLHDEGGPNFFSNALGSMCVQAGIQYSYENHDIPHSREIIDSDIFGAIYNMGWRYNYRWHERFDEVPEIGDALNHLVASQTVINAYAAAQSAEPEVLVFGSRIDGFVNHGRISNFDTISGVDFFTSLFSYFQILPHFADEYTTWVNLNNFKVVFVCGDVMRQAAIDRIVAYAQNGGKVVLVGSAGLYCVETPQLRNVLAQALNGLPNVRTMQGLVAQAPDPGPSPDAPTSPVPQEVEDMLSWGGVNRTTWAEQGGVLDQRFECIRRQIDEQSFYVGVVRRFINEYHSIAQYATNLATWGLAQTTIVLSGLPEGQYTVEKVHRQYQVVNHTMEGGCIRFNTDSAVTGELQIFKVTRLIP